MFKELIIDRNSGKPVSLQIANFVKDKIASSDLAPGSKFPTTQEFIKQVGVGPHTVRKAMKHLEKQGLVKCTPRLGTVVCEEAFTMVLSDNNNSSEAAEPKKRLRRIGIVGLVQTIDNGKVRYCVETAEGIMKESERLGVAVVALPAAFTEMSGYQMFDELMRMNCEGIIWAGGLPIDPDALKFICNKGIKIIFRRRSEGNDGWPCIQADYENAGFRTGTYFYGCGINKLAVFSHFDFNKPYPGSDLNSYPTPVRQGIIRAFEQHRSKPKFDVYVNIHEDEQTSENIYETLSLCSDDTGIVFTNGYQLFNYLTHNGQAGFELLSKFKTVAISNLTINYQLRPFVEGLDLMVLVDRFKEVGTLLVGNLLSMLDGYFNSPTTTLVNVDFVKFEQSFNIN